MFGRLLALLRGLGFIMAVVAITWLFSWLIQFICSLVLDGPGFSVSSEPINRLALVTVLVVALAALFVWACTKLIDIGVEFDDEAEGFTLLIILLLGLLAWQTFDDTPVSTLFAQIIYALLTLGLGAGMACVFISTKPTK